MTKLFLHAGLDRGVSVHVDAGNALFIRCAPKRSPDVPLPAGGTVALAVHPRHFALSAAELVALALERSASEQTNWRLRPSVEPGDDDPVSWTAIEAAIRTKFAS
ncbi:MAG: hypothetical protein RXR20_00740 [Paraburkholderia sp.]|jgi:hypothetical protein|uniref:hypothetical protein n=1 Tax=Burkholderiaceae TaxID=119060 RepID=UPI0010F50ED9|nr:hypothetical protein [Burkholderia sp. 4M9327F10]